MDMMSEFPLKKLKTFVDSANRKFATPEAIDLLEKMLVVDH